MPGLFFMNTFISRQHILATAKYHTNGANYPECEEFEVTRQD